MNNKTNILKSKLLDYTIQNQIGSGLSARVFAVYHPKLKSVCAKMVEAPFLTSKIGGKLIENQLIIHSKLKHPNILNFHQVIRTDKKVILITQLCEGGDLEKRVTSLERNQKQNVLIFQGIVKGCKYLAQNGIIHRDLKPANILIKQNEPKIADFGFAVTLYDEDLLKINAGSPLYMAPESLSKKQFSLKSDIFSLGVIFFEMITGQTPWKALSEKDLLYKIKNTPPSIALKCSYELKKLVLKCLSPSKQDRPTIEQVETQLQKLNEETDKDSYLTFREKRVNEIHQKEKKSLTLTMNMNARKKDEEVRTKTAKMKKSQKQNREGTRKFIKTKKSLSVVKRKKHQIECEQVVEQIRPQIFTFLPASLIKKLQLILTKYKQLVKGQKGEIKLQDTFYKDETIDKIRECRSQKELWQLSEGFIRRVYRLTKYYKGYKGCLTSIEKLHNIIVQYKTH